MTIKAGLAVASSFSGRMSTAAALAIAAIMTSAAAPATAQSPGLAGSWTGSGTVVFPSGASERAKCRVRYSQTTTTRYKAVGVCATSSGRVEQTATLRRVSDTRYIGTFYNSEYGITGSISVVLRGSSQSVSLNGENGASASLRLSR